MPNPMPQSASSNLVHGTPVPAPRTQKHWNIEKVAKRDGRMVPFEQSKVVDAIFRAARAVGGNDREEALRLSEVVCRKIEELGKKFPTVEEIQDIVEKVLIEEGHATTAKAYILYRAKRAELRSAANESLKGDDKEKSALLHMFAHKSKLASLLGYDRIEAYKNILFYLKTMQKTGKLATHQEGNYLGNNELATTIYQKKYYLKTLEGEKLEHRPEDVFARLAAFMASVEPDEKRQQVHAEDFYKILYEGYFMPGGRVLAGSGDLYRLKTLANCFVSVIEEDNLESIYKAAYECARTYSYGGGIGVDITTLRPSGSVVHNAADESTGAVSFMELYSLTTGLIGQAGRRGALMLTLDIKHPDSPLFVKVKKNPNWVTRQILEQCKMSGKFSAEQLSEIERQVRENTQVRSANISLKMNDEFMRAVEEQNEHGAEAILVYEKDKSVSSLGIPQGGEVNYSYGIPSKPIERYTLRGTFTSISELNAFLAEQGCGSVTHDILGDAGRRDMFGDYLLASPHSDSDFAIKYSGDFMLYFNSAQTGEIKRLVKARELWNAFVEGNYRTAEPGLLFWTRMSSMSPSNYAGRPIASTNPCGEIPLEDGGACNLGSINLSRFVHNPYGEAASIDWDGIARTAAIATRFLDNVVTWNETLNPLEKQRRAAKETRRLGIGVMGIADMLNELGMGYDSEKGIAVIEQVMGFIANAVYRASADIAQEKGSSPIFDYEAYSRGEFFQKSLNEETREIVRQKGLRNIALLSIAPTGSISNIVLSYQFGGKNYIGVSSGVEPIFSLYYTRRSESFQNQMFKVFHSTVSAYIEQNNLQDKVQTAGDMEELKRVLPTHFFRTAHFVAPDKRVEIQGVCQQYIDHSISSTVNLPEDIEPEVISNIYLDAWRTGLKGITIYREGSRFAILSTVGEKSAIEEYKNSVYKWEGKEVNGDDVISLPSGRLTTVFHALHYGWMKADEAKVLRVVEGAEKMDISTQQKAEQPVAAAAVSTAAVLENEIRIAESVAKEEEQDAAIDSVPHDMEPQIQLAFVKNEPDMREQVEAKPFDFAQDKSFGLAQDKPFGLAQDKPFDFAQDKSFGLAQDKPHATLVSGQMKLYTCPACQEQTLKMDNGCNTCINESCGYGQCEV